MVRVVRLKVSRDFVIGFSRTTLYSKWILDDGGAEPGDEVIVIDKMRKSVGMGFYEGVGAIGVRLLKFGGEEPIEDVIRRNLEFAIKRREFYPFDSMRIVNADGDYLPGLIIDRYRNVAVIQSSSVGMDRYIRYIGNLLKRLNIADYIYVKNTQRSRLDAGLELYSEWLTEPMEEVIIEEDSVKFKVNVVKGQKTGFFLDHRLNRIELSKYSHNMKVLDLFSYTGGFGIQCLAKGATKAVFVEEDEAAIELLRENLKLNNLSDKAEIIHSRVEDFLLDVKKINSDIIIIDPPALVPRRKDLNKGLNKYGNILREVVSKSQKGTLIFASCCSYFVKIDRFKSLIEKTCSELNKIVYYFGGVRSTSPDHIYKASDRELQYLKAFLFRVE